MNLVVEYLRVQAEKVRDALMQDSVPSFRGVSTPLNSGSVDAYHVAPVVGNATNLY